MIRKYQQPNQHHCNSFDSILFLTSMLLRVAHASLIYILMSLFFIIMRKPKGQRGLDNLEKRQYWANDHEHNTPKTKI